MALPCREDSAPTNITSPPAAAAVAQESHKGNVLGMARGLGAVAGLEDREAARRSTLRGNCRGPQENEGRHLGTRLVRGTLQRPGELAGGATSRGCPRRAGGG